MIGFRLHYWLNLVVLMAIGATLSLAGDVTASTSSCCVTPVRTKCCCAPSAIEARAGEVERSVAVGFQPVSKSCTAGPCECRSSEQPASAPRPASCPAASRFDRDRGHSIATDDQPVPSMHSDAGRILVFTCPSDLRIYLHNARLLI